HDAQLGQAHRYGARRDQDHFPPGIAYIAEHAAERFHLPDVDQARFVCKRRGSHFEYNPLCVLNGFHFLRSDPKYMVSSVASMRTMLLRTMRGNRFTFAIWSSGTHFWSI